MDSQEPATESPGMPTLESARYRGDPALLASLNADELIKRHLETAGVEARTSAMRSRVRLGLLAEHVRVDARLIPKVDEAIQRVRQRLNIRYPMEAYVFDRPFINAWATEGQDQVYIGLSSAAVNNLAEPELECVIGHELGHAFYGHTDAVVRSIVEHLPDPRRRMKVMAWSRAAEVSADRAGLIACGDIHVAARAMFQVLSGLQIGDVTIEPADFVQQWELLEDEIEEVGETSHWQLTHPFLHLRMKAMMLFWDAVPAKEAASGASADNRFADVDAQVERLLAIMDPLARENSDTGDPLLSDFFLWGGLYMALSHGDVSDAEKERLATVTSASEVESAVSGGTPSMEQCLQNFDDVVRRRRKKLSAAEIFRIMDGLTAIAKTDSDFGETEQAALREIADRLGVSADVIIAANLA